MFRDPQFVRDFVGSYGFISEVEPKVTPEESRVLVKIQEWFEESKFSEAETELVRFIKETEAPSDPEQQPKEISAAMVFVLGNLYFSADRTDEARRAFLEALRRFPKFRRAHVNLGYLYVSKEEFDKAQSHFQEAISLGEGNPRVFGLLGYTYLLQQQALAAENAYRQAYLLDPKSKDWKLGLAQALLQQEKYDEASSLLGDLIEEFPEDPQLWLQQTNALLAQEKKIEAATNLEVLRMKGLAGESELNLLGNLYMDQSEPQLALFAYLAALEKAPSLNIDTALKSAKILNDYGFPEKASSYVEEVRRKAGDGLSDEDRLQVDLIEVQIARADGNLVRVGALLEDLLARDPANGEVLLELGKHYDQLAKEADSEEEKRKYLMEAKTRLQVASGRDGDTGYGGNLALGQLLTRELQYVEALPYLERAEQMKPSENLKSYVNKVRRAADRQRQREEREAADREAKEKTKR
ncbi:tetratricopeptide (TPR) repeat protein [Haloferula luteola]|uniref:Tetratricopeptide (TPR) repeat protein n=1 Tax=Haloferula luteola TaxID=595692 RepID=A0A840V919_9BACT|nr:tetratricopeptide repeat protein [Haloferula luteola]MBB5350279.1 tetratricopeptide (TPR) repeat protein [Haloferula luteola]